MAHQPHGFTPEQLYQINGLLVPPQLIVCIKHCESYHTLCDFGILYSLGELILYYVTLVFSTFYDHPPCFLPSICTDNGERL